MSCVSSVATSCCGQNPQQHECCLSAVRTRHRPTLSEVTRFVPTVRKGNLQLTGTVSEPVWICNVSPSPAHYCCCPLDWTHLHPNGLQSCFTKRRKGVKSVQNLSVFFSFSCCKRKEKKKSPQQIRAPEWGVKILTRHANHRRRTQCGVWRLPYRRQRKSLV